MKGWFNIIKEREQKVIDKKHKRSCEFDKCIFCGAEKTRDPVNSPGFYQLVLYDVKKINEKKYTCANYACKTCGSRWLGDWYLDL